MPIEVYFDKKNDVIFRRIFGKVNLEEITGSIIKNLTHLDYHPGIKSLTDLREVEHFVNASDIKKFADFILESGEAIKGGKAAIVVSAEVTFGMIRMLQTYTDKSSLQIEVFKDINEAKNWLGLRDNS